MKSSLLRMSAVLSGMLVTIGLPAGTPARAQGATARYVVTDLGTLGGANSFAYSMNRSGMVTGGANTPGQNDLFAQTAFLWYGGPLINLGTLGDGACPDCSSQGAAAAPDGSVVMISETANADPDGQDFCEFGTHRQCLPAISRLGLLTPLRTLPGGNNAEAFFTNSRGEAVGASEIGALDATCATPFQVHLFEAVKWTAAGEPTPLRPLSGDTVSFAFTNNDNGQVAGFSGLCSNVTLPPFLPPSAPHAVIWDASGTPHDLGSPTGGAGDNVATAINNQAQITVNSVMLDGTVHASVWNGTGLQDLGTYPSDAFVTAVPCCNNINDRGQIAGFSIDSQFNQRAILWANTNTAPVDLNAWVPADSPWYLISPGGISAAGEIAVTAVNLQTFEIHAVVLSPVNGVGGAVFRLNQLTHFFSSPAACDFRSSAS